MRPNIAFHAGIYRKDLPDIVSLLVDISIYFDAPEEIPPDVEMVWVVREVRRLRSPGTRPTFDAHSYNGLMPASVRSASMASCRRRRGGSRSPAQRKRWLSGDAPCAHSRSVLSIARPQYRRPGPRRWTTSTPSCSRPRSYKPFSRYDAARFAAAHLHRPTAAASRWCGPLMTPRLIASALLQMLLSFVNGHFSTLGMHVDDLLEDLHDGARLIILVGLIGGFFVPMGSYYPSPSAESEKVRPARASALRCRPPWLRRWRSAIAARWVTTAPVMLLPTVVAFASRRARFRTTGQRLPPLLSRRGCLLALVAVVISCGRWKPQLLSH